MKFEMKRRRKRQTWKKCGNMKSFVAWEPEDEDVYDKLVTTKLQTSWIPSSGEVAEDIDNRCKMIELLLRETAEECAKIKQTTKNQRKELSEKLKDLIRHRRQLRDRGTMDAKSHIAEVSKDIQKEIRRSMRSRGRAQIERILTDFKDLKSIAGIRANGKRHNLTNVRDSKGRLAESRQEIADVFASFYEELFASRRASYPDFAKNINCGKIPKVTAEEVKHQLQKMAKRKAGDARGIVIEMIQKGGKLLMEQLAELFSDILSQDKVPPNYWKETRLKVLF